MKNNEATIFVFLASILIGVLVSLNINFEKKPQRIVLDAKQYQDAYNTKIKLQSDISNLKNQYNQYSEKLQKYEQISENGDEVLKEIQNEIDTNKSETGYMGVHGPGIEIYISDASTDNLISDSDLSLDKILHNYDMNMIINDLRAAGAEAISVNGQRITDRSEINCASVYLSINGQKITGPFTIDAIGNKEVLNAYMSDPSNYLATLNFRQMIVEQEPKDDIVIKASEEDPKITYMSNVKK